MRSSVPEAITRKSLPASSLRNMPIRFANPFVAARVASGRTRLSVYFFGTPCQYGRAVCPSLFAGGKIPRPAATFYMEWRSGVSDGRNE